MAYVDASRSDRRVRRIAPQVSETIASSSCNRAEASKNDSLLAPISPTSLISTLSRCWLSRSCVARPVAPPNSVEDGAGALCSDPPFEEVFFDRSSSGEVRSSGHTARNTAGSERSKHGSKYIAGTFSAA